MTSETLVPGIDEHIDVETSAPDAVESSDIDDSAVQTPVGKTSAQVGETMGWVADYDTYDQEHGITPAMRRQLDEERKVIVNDMLFTD